MLVGTFPSPGATALAAPTAAATIAATVAAATIAAAVAAAVVARFCCSTHRNIQTKK